MLNIFCKVWVVNYPDPDNFLGVCIRNRLPYWQNEIFDQLLEEAQRTLDQPERIRVYQEADEILIEEAVVMPITYMRFHKLCKPWVKLPARGIVNFSVKNIILEPH